MSFVTPLPILVFRGLAGLALVGLIVHLLRVSTVAVLPYEVAGWIIVGVLFLILLQSCIRRPLSAYVIATFVPLLPAAFLAGLWIIVLKSGPVWELIVLGGSFMLLPITFSIQIIRDPAIRNYFRFRA